MDGYSWYTSQDSDDKAIGLFNTDFDNSYINAYSIGFDRHSWVCFMRYPDVHRQEYEKGNSFYIAFPFFSHFKSVIEEFNNTFENISFTVVHERSSWLTRSAYYGTMSFFTESKLNKYLKEYEGVKVADRPVWSLVRVDLSEKYNELASYQLNVVVSMFLRMHSRTLEWIKQDYGEDYIAKTIEFNQEKCKHMESSMSQYPITKEDFLRIDDVELMNKIFDHPYKDVPYLTSRTPAEDIRIGAKVRPFCFFYVIDHYLNPNLSKYNF